MSSHQRLSTYGSGTRTADAVVAGGVVLKRGGPRATGVIALLRHLESAGFDGAPRVVGDGYAPDGRPRAFIDWEFAGPVDPLPILWAIGWRARSASWIARHRGLLRRALQ